MNNQPELEAEQLFLGSMIVENDLVLDWADKLEDADFSHGEHALAWRAIKYLYRNGKPINHVSIEEAIRINHKNREAASFEYLRHLREAVYSLHMVPYHVEVIKKHSLYRKMLAIGADIQNNARNQTFETASEARSYLDAQMIKLDDKQDIGIQGMDDQESMVMQHVTSPHATVKTGLAQFDDWAGGVGRGQLHIVAGRPAAGKTAKAVQTSVDMSSLDEGDVIFFSLEMGWLLLLDRAISNATGINYKRIVRKELDDDEKQQYLAAYRQIASMPLFFLHLSRPTFGEVRSMLLRHRRKTKRRIAAVYLDYLTMMNIPVEKGQTYAKAVEDVCNNFKALSVELDCAIVLLAQIGRAGENERPTMSHLKDSGGIEQAADSIEILWEDQDDAADCKGHDYKIITSSIVKGRFTGTRDFKYKFSGHLQRYEDYTAVPKQSPSESKYVPNSDGFIHWGSQERKGRNKRS